MLTGHVHPGLVALTAGARSETGLREFSSGLLVTQGLVLACKHGVVDGDGAPQAGVEVHLVLGQRGGVELSEPLPGRVVWIGAGEMDAALIELNVVGIPSDFMSSEIKWGEIVVSNPIAVTVAGFPKFAFVATGRWEVEVAQGSITAGTYTVSDRYAVNLQAGWPKGWEYWAGVSGAPVVSEAGGQLVGVVAWSDQPMEGRRLTAVPVRRLLADLGFREVLSRHLGSLPDVEPVGLETWFTRTRAVGSPGGLLSGEAALGEFFGRDQEIQALESWRDQRSASERDVKVFLMIGRGGEGKTRLAVEFAARSRQADWISGMLRSGLSPDHAHVLSQCLRPLLLIVDYAAARTAEIEVLVRALASTRPGPPVRVLLLAREAGCWWDDLVAELEDDLPVQKGDVLLLRPLGADAEVPQPAAMFAVAAHSLAPHLPKFTGKTAAEMVQMASQITTPRWPGQDVRHVLTVQMSALVALLDECDPVGGGSNADDVAEALLRHERKYRDKLASRLGLDDVKLVRDRALSGAVLFGARGPSLPDARQAACAMVKAALTPDLDASVARQREMAAWIAGIYPPDIPAPDEETEYWGEVLPDLLAESLVIQLLAGEVAVEDGRRADRAPAGLLESLAVSTDTTGAARGLLLLSRAAERDARAAAWIGRLVRGHPRLFGCVAVQVATYAENPEPLRRALVDLGLSDAEVLRSTMEPFYDLLSRFSLRRLYASAAVAREFVDIYTQLAEIRRDVWLQDAAAALRSYASALHQIGRHLEAIRFSDSAIGLHRELAATRHDEGLPGLAAALTNHSAILDDAGHTAESVPVSEEAVSLYRQLASLDRGYVPLLAGALTNHGSSLWKAHQLEEAAHASQEALNLRWELVNLDWDTYLPDLAKSLINHTAILAGAGYYRQAVIAANKGVDLARELAEDDRDAYLPQLAVSLMNLAGRLTDSGRHEDAAQLAAEAVLACQQLAEVSPDAYLPKLAGSLSIQATALAGCGRQREALESSQIAVDLYRELVAADRSAYLADLSETLGHHAHRLAEAGRRNDALNVSQEAIALNRELVSRNRDAHLSQLATSLTNRVVLLAQIGHYDDAMPVSLEAIALDRELVTRNRHVALSGLAATLSNHATMLENTGDAAMAIPLWKEAANSYLELAELGQKEYLEDYVYSLGNLGHLLFEAQQT